MARLGKIERDLLKSARSKPATVLYPFSREGINCPSDLRGKWDYANPARCTGCRICERVCCSGAIEMIPCRPEDAQTKTGERPICHLDRCTSCAQCVESCPRDVLVLTDTFELAFMSRDKMIVY